MKPKTILTVALVIFLCAAAAYLVLDEVHTKSAAREEQSGQSTAPRSTEQRLAPALSEEPASPTGKTALTEPAQAGPDKAAGPGTSELRAITNKPRQTPTDSRQKTELRIASAPSKQTAVPPSSQPPRSQATGSQLVSPQSVDSKSSAPKPSDSQNPRVTSAQKVLAYYFHGTQRCPTCRKLEAYSAEAIEKGFGEALKRGNLEWRGVNVDEPLNKHFVKDYQLYTKSLVIVKMQGGKQVEWKNLEKIWELVGEKDDFVRYVQDEVSAYLGERK
jgi:hypothetical protein